MPKQTYKRKRTNKRKQTYKRKHRGGIGRYKEPRCSQKIVSEARIKCVKICRQTKKSIANEKELLRLNKNYDAYILKMCKADDNYDCIQKHREGDPVFEELIRLESATGEYDESCRNKHCTKEELNRLDDCIDLGEEQCRIKYDKLIKKSKHKILPLAECNPELL